MKFCLLNGAAYRLLDAVCHRPPNPLMQPDKRGSSGAPSAATRRWRIADCRLSQER
jgi:hypothetical protein